MADGHELRDAASWHARARTLRPGGLALIDGVLQGAHSGATFEDISPVDGRKLTDVAACDASDVDDAVSSARSAFERGVWAGEAPEKRKRVLLRFAELIERATEELALLETLDMGKPIRDSIQIDASRDRLNCVRWYAEAIDKIYERSRPRVRGTLALMTREPVGVVGAIVPWNFPMVMAAWKIGPDARRRQLADPQAVGEVPADGLQGWRQLALEAGVPPGVFNVVPGLGSDGGQARWPLHMDVDA